MTKRRTRKEKKNAKHVQTVSWAPSATDVNRHFTKPASTKISSKSKMKNADVSANLEGNKNLTKSVLKSLFLALFIILIEVVIYLFTVI